MMMKLRSLLYTALAVIALGSCNSKAEDKGMLAAASARTAYEHLMKGEYEMFVRSTVGYDSLPAAYNEQVVTSIKQYVHTMKRAHGDIAAVDVLNATAIDSLHKAQVFLLLHFTDSTTEQVSVQMVERDGKWYLR